MENIPQIEFAESKDDGCSVLTNQFLIVSNQKIVSFKLKKETYGLFDLKIELKIFENFIKKYF